MRNRLGEETSPYLLQHAANPVHWQAWDDASLAAAKDADKPILLSIGYSACHWCHVMAHESFEDEATARLMNDLYVNVKVDREERPDIDKIYQTAHQLYNSRPGGWPLTVFLTPDDHVPIYTGTYFPREPRYGMPAFRDVLTGVAAYYRSSRGEIRTRGTALAQAFEELTTRAGDEFAALSRAPLELARARLGKSYDREHGGFGDAPKFPHAPMLELTLAHWRRSRDGGAPDAEALAIVTHTLDRMALAGLYDQLGGGFYRYSVDRAWSIPHFEKMLYDNAALLPLYADAFAATGSELYRRVASETADWSIREMQDPRGGFYSTLDADSEHEEGKFYVWTPEEFDALLSPDESRVAKRVLGLSSGPNFEQHFWHLHIAAPTDAAAAELGFGTERGAELLASARAKLLAARDRRVWPGRDDKILVSWNGLMIAGLARAARVLGRDDLAAAAARAVDFIRAEMWAGGRLKATYKDGRARFAAYLDDYAFLAAGLLELLQCRWRGSDLQFACDLADALLGHFEDERGGFFFTADDHETLIHKPKPFGDEAVPSGNGVAAGALLRLGHVTGEQRYLDAAERTIRASLGGIQQYPEGHATLLHALDELLSPPQLVVVRAPAHDLDAWRAALRAPAAGAARYEPHRFALAIPSDADGLRGLLAERAARPNGGVAYVCEGMTCRAPLDTPAALTEALAHRAP